MKKKQLYLLFSALLLIAVTFVVYYIYQLNGIFECPINKQSTELSPDGKHVAIIFDIDCGTATGFNTQLSIIPTQSTFDPISKPSALALKGKQTLKLQWINDTKLHVVIPKDAPQYRKESTDSGVSIEYEFQ